MAQVVHLLSKKTNGQALLVSDVGQHQMVTARYYEFKKPNSHITSGGLGTMGFALPAAIGAKIAAMERQVIAIIGDGGFQMNIQELGVISQENLPVKIIILNNNHLGMVRQWQELFFEQRYSFVHLKNPDFVKISEGYDIAAYRVADSDNLDQALDIMLKSNTPYLLEIVVEREENIFPMIPSGAGVDEVRLF
jgi:acetolactate synthase-1/2/3 large subunit